jgi:hypothetical protein
MLSAQLQALTPPSEELRAGLGTIEVTAATPTTGQQVSRPVRNESVGRAAARGAAKGALVFLAAPFSGAGAGDPYAGALLLLAPLLAPVGAIVGAGAGAIHESAENAANTIPSDVADGLERALQELLADEEPEARLRQKLGARAEVRNVAVLDVGQTMAMASGRIALEVGVTSVGLVGIGGRDPELTLVVEATARLLDATDNRELWALDRMVFTSSPHRSSEWIANDSTLLKSVVDNLLEMLARRIAEKVFLEVWTD